MGLIQHSQPYSASGLWLCFAFGLIYFAWFGDGESYSDAGDKKRESSYLEVVLACAKSETHWRSSISAA